MRTKKIILISLLLILFTGITGTVSAADSLDDRTLSVSGTGKVTSAPDTVIISIAVETENTDALVAQQENADKMNTVIEGLKAVGMNDDEIETTGYNIYSYTSSEDSVFGSKKKIYKVTNTIKVESSNIDMAGKIIDTAVSSGANNINYISFTLSEEKSNQLRSQALDAAVAQARSDADAVTSALGVTIMGVKSVNVGASYVPMNYDTAYGSGAMYKSEASMAPTTVEPGDVDVSASVSIVYLIR